MANHNSKEPPVICSFCGAGQDDVHIMFGKSGAYICDRCVRLCIDTIEDHDGVNRKAKKPVLKEKKPLLKPAQLKEKLDEYVIGQEDAKKSLSVAVKSPFWALFCENGFLQVPCIWETQVSITLEI